MEENFVIEGIEKVEFNFKDRNEPVKGYHIHMSQALEAPNVGKRCSKCFLSEERFEIQKKNLIIGTEVSVLYSRYGKPRAFVPCDQALDFGN